LQAASTGTTARDGGYALTKGQGLSSIQRQCPKSFSLSLCISMCELKHAPWLFTGGSARRWPKVVVGFDAFGGNARHLAYFVGEFNASIIRLISLLQLDQKHAINKWLLLISCGDQVTVNFTCRCGTNVGETKLVPKHVHSQLEDPNKSPVHCQNLPKQLVRVSTSSQGQTVEGWMDYWVNKCGRHLTRTMAFSCILTPLFPPPPAEVKNPLESQPSRMNFKRNGAMLVYEENSRVLQGGPK
jgi:hypothetical protein